MRRNLFFRVSSLILMGVKLVFVMEGEAPKLKTETMIQRTANRFGGPKNASKSSTGTSRGRFNAVLREVVLLVDPDFEHYCHGVCVTLPPLVCSVQRCLTTWECRGWLPQGKPRPCVRTWTHIVLWMVASPMMETCSCTEHGPSTETSI